MNQESPPGQAGGNKRIVIEQWDWNDSSGPPRLALLCKGNMKSSHLIGGLSPPSRAGPSSIKNTVGNMISISLSLRVIM